MIKKLSIAPSVLIGACFLSSIAGCPDRSMLRAPPDISKQSDSDSEDSVTDDPELAESEK